MTKTAIMELVKVVKERYKASLSRKDKTKILTEFCSNTGYHRKSAIRVLNKPDRKRRCYSGRPKYYHEIHKLILKEVWELMDCICAERLVEHKNKILDKLVDKYTKEDIGKVREMSKGTMKNMIGSFPKPYYRRRPNRGNQRLYKEIPINSRLRKANVYGHLGVDFVDHNGGDPSGEFCRTITLVDIKTLWTTNGACLGRQQSQVEKAADIALARFPSQEIHETHPDNENGLLAVMLIKRDLKMRGIKAVTRSRPNMKNDNCHVEERNNERVRKHIGYRRYTRKHLDLLNQLYGKLDDYCNFFIPSMKLKRKVYNKFTHKLIKKEHDKPKTPYERILECKEVDVKVKMELMQKYHKLDILKLRSEIDELLHKLSNV